MKKYLPKNTPQAELTPLPKDGPEHLGPIVGAEAGDGEGPIAFYFKNPDCPVISAWRTKVSPLTGSDAGRV